ncbi:MAG: hypothetical protein IJ679_07825, partial [Lachnospiraceae bacterium]|nr:hypothetical protein [Lachnospiraceae bacterium]
MVHGQNEQDTMRGVHLLILATHTFFTALLLTEGFILRWERWVIPILLGQLIFCWSLHMLQAYTPKLRIQIYAIFEILMFFFYGVHETSFYDLAPVITFVLLLYTMLQSRQIVFACVLSYYFTAFYDLIMFPEVRPEATPINITRMLLHFLVVPFAGFISLSILKKRDENIASYLARIQELEEANKRTEEFLTNVSHELRTPINAVTGISGVLLKGETDPERKSSLKSIREAGQHLFEQIEDILDYTELRTERLVVQQENYMISSLIGDLYAEIRTAFVQRAPSIIFDIDPQIPSVLLGDSRKIKKILRHLVINALKFTPNGMVLVRVSSIPKPYGINLFI